MSLKTYSSEVELTSQVMLVVNLRTKEIEGVLPFICLKGLEVQQYIFKGSTYNIDINMLGDFEGDLDCRFGDYTYGVILEDCTINESTVNYSVDIEKYVKEKRKVIREMKSW